MDKRIIFQQAGSPVNIIIPGECGLSLDEIGRKDVPRGMPYWIVDVEYIPVERSFRAAWELDRGELGPASGLGEAK